MGGGTKGGQGEGEGEREKWREEERDEKIKRLERRSTIQQSNCI